jgi:hypothetical protein
VHQVGYLQELYRDVRSTEHRIKYKIQGTWLSISYRSGFSGFVVMHVFAVRFVALSAEEMN